MDLVEIVTVEGIEWDDRNDFRGAMEIGNSGSFGLRTNPGDHESGARLSPKENNRANLCLAVTSRPRGRSVIILRAKRFA